MNKMLQMLKSLIYKVSWRFWKLTEKKYKKNIKSH